MKNMMEEATSAGVQTLVMLDEQVHWESLMVSILDFFAIFFKQKNYEVQFILSQALLVYKNDGDR